MQGPTSLSLASIAVVVCGASDLVRARPCGRARLLPTAPKKGGGERRDGKKEERREGGMGKGGEEGKGVRKGEE